MRIKRIEVDGFKSYAQKQVIDGFDATFNAITGLNGSGKSNILDSICFVLGITNLTQVRATQLQDLVYKQGQAGVTKATVSITFDNTDDSNKPLGYDRYDEIVVRRQVIIGGRNTYTINGTAATNQRVADLFRSVGLNVNNPHFLIMQGRITKVLNMKPMEILGMIEEAAGTKMYETKKQSAIKTIEKKDAKVGEINRLLAEDIMPRVEQLKSDRANYLEFNKLTREVEALERKSVAYDFYASQATCKQSENEIAQKNVEIGAIDSKVEANEATTAEIHAEIKKLEDKKEDGKKKQLEEGEKGALDQQAKAMSKFEGAQDAVKAANVEVTRRNKTLKEDEKAMEKKQKELAKAEEEIGGAAQRGTDAEEAVQKARKKLEAIAKGMTTDDDGQAVTLEEQLTNARTALSDINTKVKLAENRLKQLQPSLAKKKRELLNVSDRADSKDKKAALEKDLEAIDGDLQRLNFSEAAEQELENERLQLEREVGRLKDELQHFEARHPNLRFIYQDPRSGFDRNAVKGLVAKLIRMKEMRDALAVEIAAGGSLYNVVVDTTDTGKDLLANGKLQKRVTLIPLDKVRRDEIDRRALQQAQQLVGKDHCRLAKNLIEYDKAVDAAMAHVFGRTLVCDDMDMAKKVTYDPRVRARSVTLAGEDFNPSGTLSGGSRGNRTALLEELNAVVENEEKVGDNQRRLNDLKASLNEMRTHRKRFEDLNRRRTELKAQLDVIIVNMQHNPAEVLRNEIAEIEAEIAEHRATVDGSAQERATLQTKIAELEDRKKNEKAFHEKEKKDAEKQLKTAEKAYEALKDGQKTSKATLDMLRQEVDTLRTSLEEDKQEVEAANEAVRQAVQKADDLKKDTLAAEQLVKEAREKLEEYRVIARAQEEEVQKHLKNLDRLKKDTHTAGLRKNQLQGEIDDIRKTAVELEKRMKQLVKQFTWIEEEKKHFGKAGSSYDFGGTFNAKKARQELEDKKARKDDLSKKVNMKAMNMLTEAENQARKLEDQKSQLEKDKQQLMETIEQLDLKKKEEIIKAHEQVNRDFGSIFSSLLPGTSAKLDPPGGKSPLDGLEVRVAFRDQWKDSLGELSGGQRSLVALSLVLAMLKFKPAPIYILDEVDAALDLSHTQNIGSMIKSYFQESQFIIVSLKDGMFNHANVLFKTKFVDGTSTVTRTTNVHSDGRKGK